MKKYNTSSFPTRLDKTKWIPTRRCGCGECTFYDPAERGECPLANAPGSVQLWMIDPDMLGYKDYIDPYDYMVLPAFNERSLEVQENPETDATDPSQ